MGEADVLERGAQGERQVAEMLQELRPKYGYGLLHDVLVEFNGHTSQMDHVLIDQFGLLVIETKCYGALLKGTSDDHDWTACYRNGTTRPMFNPLKQNDIHRKWLRKVLVQNQRDMPENYVQSLIVFARGEIGELSLSEVDQMRVLTPTALPEYIGARYEFRPNAGQLGPEAQKDLWEFMCSANKSADPEVMARHIATAKEAKSGRRSPRRAPGPRKKSQAELKWDAKQARRAERQRSEAIRGLVALGIGVAMLSLMALSSCVSAAVR